MQREHLTHRLGAPRGAGPASTDASEDTPPRPALPARRLPIGAEPHPSGAGTHFRVWAPGKRRVEVVLEATSHLSQPLRQTLVSPLEPESDGYFGGLVAEAEAGALYRFRLDDEPRLCPDPASRFQPHGPHGPSQVIDPLGFRWSDQGWRGVAPGRRALAGQVLYELHVGTFTVEGTWSAAQQQLPRLAELGITVLQIMPVAEFPGAFGWGYDGIALFAPYHGYGHPADFRRFVDAAHRLGLAVILDVVYNHLGPDGNYLTAFTPSFFSRRHTTDWGQAINFDGPGCEGVRTFYLANVRHWVEEYHLDGFRFDATQDIHDDGPEPILAALAREARCAANGRGTLLVAENEPQDAKLVKDPASGGYGLDLIGNEDFHHAALVALTGRREGYYENHLGSSQEILSAVKHGFLYQGQWYHWQRQRRGTSTRGVPRRALLHFLENHDQVANTAHGERLQRVTSPGRWRAFVALQLLAPQTPFLFQGQEFGSSRPFLYFADHRPELAAATRRGRLKFLEQFKGLATPEMQERLADPFQEDTFLRCKLDWSEWDRHPQAVALHRDLLALRREDPALSGRTPCELDGAVLGPRAFLLRWLAPEQDRSNDRLFLINWGTELRLVPAPEPLLAPPAACAWGVLWSSESPVYGGSGTPPVETDAWNLPGEAAVMMAPVPSPSPAGAREAGGAPEKAMTDPGIP